LHTAVPLQPLRLIENTAVIPATTKKTMPFIAMLILLYEEWQKHA